jgi:hypothetical protein
LFPCVQTIGGGNFGVIFVNSSSRRRAPPPTCASRRRHDGIFAVAAGELGYPSRRIDTINLVFNGTKRKVVVQKDAIDSATFSTQQHFHFAELCLYAHMSIEYMHIKKNTRKKGKKHRTASEKGKSRNIDNVLTFICFSPLRSKKSQPKGIIFTSIRVE